MINEREKELVDIFKDRVTTDPFELSQYTKDVAYVPPFLVKLMASPMPQAVVQPVNSEEIALLLQTCSRTGTPITVRGGCSSAYFNAIAIHGGIVVDMNRLQGISSVVTQQGENTVWIKAGTTWSEVEAQLRPQGCCLCSYPTSSPSATAGGWISMGGLGIGSIRYGPLRDQVQALRIVTAQGEIQELSTDDVKPSCHLNFTDCFGTEGTRAIITEVNLKVRTLPEKEVHTVITFEGIEEAGKMLQALAQIPEVFNVHFSSPSLIETLQKKGYVQELPHGTYCLSIDLDGSKRDVEEASEKLLTRALSFGGKRLPPEVGEEEWKNRFKALRLKQAMPSLQAAELLIPVENFSAYYQALDKLATSQKTFVVTYAHLVPPHHVLTMTLYPSNELKTGEYILDLSFISKIYQVGKKYKGKPYVVGFWNTSYLKDIFSSEEIVERQGRKQLLDQANLLNPGKSYRTPLLLTQPIFGLGMTVLAALRPLLSGGREHD